MDESWRRGWRQDQFEVQEALEKWAGTSEKEVKDRVRRNWAWEKEERAMEIVKNVIQELEN